MFNIINPELVVFNYDKLEDGDVFTYTPPYCFGYKAVYTVFKTGMYVHVTVTKIYKDQCEVEKYRIKENQKYYLDRYGNPVHYYKNSIQDYLIKNKKLPPYNVELVTLDQLKEELYQERVTPLISKLNDEIKEYSEIEKASVILKGEIIKNLRGGDEVLLEHDGGYGSSSYTIFITKEDEEEEKGIFEM